MKKALICTVLNEESSIGIFLDSIKVQTLLPDEIIVVDGGSRDKTRSIIKKHSLNKRKKITLITKKGNRSTGRNAAIEASRSEIIAITDSGCILDKNWFKNITLPFKSKNVDVVAGYYKAKPKNIFQKSMAPYVLVMEDRVNSKEFLPATRSMAIRRIVWEENGRFSESLSNNEDYDFAVKLRRNNFNIRFAKNAVAYWLPRTNINQAFIMFYRFAKGDIEAKIFRPKVGLIFVRYLIGLFLIIGYFKYSNNVILLLSLTFLSLYIGWSISKNYKYVKNPLAFIYLPFLQFLSDIAVLLGSTVVLISNFFYLICGGLFVYLLFNGINLPYVGQNAYNFITYSLIAHNYNQFGYLATKFSSLISVSAKYPANPEYFIHHPPLISIIESLFLKILGEDFWVGRLSVILFTLLTMVVIYLIDRKLSNSKLAITSLSIALLLPATVIFGKMIGQEVILLFFSLLSLYFLLNYFSTKKNIYLLFSSIGAIFATLSDWPALYFFVFLTPLYISKKELRKAWVIPLASFITVVFSLAWIAFIRSGFWDLENAVKSRLFTALFDIDFWPIVWILTQSIRFVIYFNPIFLIFSIISIFTFVKKIKVNKLAFRDLVVLILGIFGIFHILLYTEASFTHPYLVYYLIPFVALASSPQIKRMIDNKQYIYFSFIFLFSLLFLVSVYIVKDQQNKANVWRYDLAKSIRPYLNKYETIVFNINYAIDHDIWRYPLLINPVLQDENNSSSFLKKYNHYVYSCSPTCSVYGGQIKSLTDRYQYIVFRSQIAEAYLFFLNKKQDGTKTANNKTVYRVRTDEYKQNMITHIYRYFRDKLNVPQI